MCEWTEAEAVEYFDSGGTVRPELLSLKRLQTFASADAIEPLTEAELVVMRQSLDEGFKDVDNARVKLMLSALIHSVVHLQKSGAPPAASAEMTAVLCERALDSGRPAEVVTYRGSGSDADPPATVLILAGGAVPMPLLKPLVRLYQARWPHWHVVASATGGSRSGPAAGEPPLGCARLTPHVDAIMAALKACDASANRVIVHAQSNNGMNVWAELMVRHAAWLNEHVIAIIYDCAAVRMRHYRASKAPIYSMQVHALLKGIGMSDCCPPTDLQEALDATLNSSACDDFPRTGP